MSSASLPAGASLTQSFSVRPDYFCIITFHAAALSSPNGSGEVRVNATSNALASLSFIEAWAGAPNGDAGFVAHALSFSVPEGVTEVSVTFANTGTGDNSAVAIDHVQLIIGSPAVPPLLEFGRLEDGGLVLSWPAAAGGFVLETSGQPHVAGTWTEVTLPASEDAGRKSVQIDATDALQFFRLRKP